MAGEIEKSEKSGRRGEVLVVGLTGRSGASFFAELIAAQAEDSALFFEPLRSLEDIDPACAKSVGCVAGFLGALFRCQLRDSYELHMKTSSQLFLSFFNEESAGCYKQTDLSHRSKCFSDINMVEACLKSDLRVVKTVRPRLGKIIPLLKHEQTNLKIVHLYRDPRAVLYSVNRFSGLSHNITKYCSDIEQDLKSYVDLKKIFPNNIVRVSYDRFASNPSNESKILFDFVFSGPELSGSVLSSLKSHSHRKKSGVINRVKNPASVYQDWRLKMTPRLLIDVQTNPDCKTSIRMMGHRMFNDIAELRDLSISL